MKRTFMLFSACLLASLVFVPVRADSPAVPPPSVEDGQILIPRHLVRLYATVVHPDYVRWLQNGDGLQDSVASFTLYVSLCPMSNHERWCYITLYNQSH